MVEILFKLSLSYANNDSIIFMDIDWVQIDFVHPVLIKNANVSN